MFKVLQGNGNTVFYPCAGGRYIAQGYIKFVIVEQMAMPVPIQIKEANGKVHNLTIPVESWMRSAEATIFVYPTSKITEVILDPEKKLPDLNRKNNSWKPGT